MLQPGGKHNNVSKANMYIWLRERINIPYLRFHHLEEREKKVRLCVSMLEKDSARFFGIADLLQKIFQRHQPSRHAEGRGNEKGISLNECPEGLALRVTKKHQQALGAETKQSEHSRNAFFSKKLHQSGVKKEKFGLVLRVLLDFAYPKFPSGFVSRAARRSRSGMENHHWRCRCGVLQKWFHQAIYFEIKRKTKVPKTKLHHVTISPSNRLFWRDQQKTILLQQSKLHCPWTQFAYCRQHFMTWHQCHDRI